MNVQGLFRGKPTEAYKDFLQLREEFCKDDFVYGSLVIQHNVVTNDRYFICVSAKCSEKSFINNGITTMCEVIPETVGQCIGIRDKLGRKIYTGDIIKSISVNGTSVSIVKYGKYEADMFYDLIEKYLSRSHKRPTEKMVGVFAESIKGEQMMMTDASSIIQVIGNIHNNPELLEVKT